MAALAGVESNFDFKRSFHLAFEAHVHVTSAEASGQPKPTSAGFGGT
jgi:hypothetical protein